MKRMSREALKIVTIGGGSSYTPELMEGFINRYGELPIREIWLVDIEEGKNKLEIVGKLAQRMWQKSGYPCKVYLTLDRREALKDADFVTTQMRIGRMNARILDEKIPASHGILGQETNGAGGIFKALRTIPVMLDIVKDMKDLCPNAWLINFTNPSGIVTEAVITKGKWDKVVGLCNVPVGAMTGEAKILDMKEEDMIYQFAGLNHFHWHRTFDKYGHDYTREILEKMGNGEEWSPNNIKRMPFIKEQLLASHVIPCPYHRQYFLEYEMTKHAVEESLSVGTRGEKIKEIEKQLFEVYQDEGLYTKPALLNKRGGGQYSDAACGCINAIYNNQMKHMVLTTKNNGAIADLPYDCAVEISCMVSGKGPIPINWGKFDPYERGWVQVMKAMEQCTIEAATTGDYGKALQAFMINPLIPGGHFAKDLLDEMLVAHKKYLPLFHEAIESIENR